MTRLGVRIRVFKLITGCSSKGVARCGPEECDEDCCTGRGTIPRVSPRGLQDRCCGMLRGALRRVHPLIGRPIGLKGLKPRGSEKAPRDTPTWVVYLAVGGF